MSEQPQKKSYKDTINKPQTAFAMKANLVQNEPASMKRWAEAGLYQKVRQARAGAPRYVFHDGPPYANGSIHLGHLLNKVLKDIVVRSRTMMGFDCPYIPGWDCHGLPIEHKVVAELGPKAREMEPYQIRRKCQAYAEKFVKLQSGQMQRLLTLADYEHPYLTMDPAYEGASLEVFAQMVEKGLVYRALKPVHWSIANQTALADAELEYEDRVDTSIYVLFEVVTASPLHAACGLASGVRVDLMIWTTTPWTLPANLAVAAAPRALYGLFSYQLDGKTHHAILADDLADRVLALRGAADIKRLAVCTGQELVSAGLRYRHPFIDRTSPIVTAEYVTLEDGTGLVHTAPGHGVEDYQTGLKDCIRFSPDRREVLAGKPSDPSVRADTYCPVRGDGTFDETAPDWLRAPGVDVWKANDLVIVRLRESGHLFYDLKFTHSYPHDWRGRTPVIFRATEQWFVGVDWPIGFSFFDGQGHGNADAPSIRKLAIEAVEKKITFYPDWGKNRLRGMLESRPDWCISRQRAWGLPIPAFFGEGDQVLLTAAAVRAVAKVVEKQGSDAWFKLSAAELLAGYEPEKDAYAPAWVKEGRLSRERLKKSTDIFDVWFDSGTSWASVIRQRFGADWLPTDLYLEGSDQHRGWFQASLLPAVATTGEPPYHTGQPPFKALLTHGFMVDKDGKKMSKALGNTLEVETLLKDHGADVCRWWVSSINADNDIKVDPEFFKLAGEEYRKVRNTLRYLLSNLYDFDIKAHRHAWVPADATSLDAWVIGELNLVIAAVRAGYEKFDFRALHETVFDFCNETLSAVYLAATKDRMYCDKADSPRRRRSQTAMHTIADALIRLTAPILPHTVEEAWKSLHGESASSVQLETFPNPVELSVSGEWAGVIASRNDWLKAVEEARQGRGIENPLDCAIVVPRTQVPAGFSVIDLADLCNVSRIELTDGAEISVKDLREEPRCDRSWKRDGTVKLRGDGGMLSDRDAAALGVV
ncbi:MAG: isoleucine--tRNA ligase [Planctomycetes bacterium]|nr:isoleucine--tRNA ligase [Planctomycetota bacterium]